MLKDPCNHDRTTVRYAETCHKMTSYLQAPVVHTKLTVGVKTGGPSDTPLICGGKGVNQLIMNPLRVHVPNN